MQYLVTITALPLLASAFTVKSAVFLGNVTTAPDDNSIRDLGWSGKIGNTIIDTFGDSFQCDNAYYQTRCGPLAHYLYSNAAGIEKSSTSFTDSPDSTTPSQFCAYYSDESATSMGLGTSNVVPTSSNAGVLYTYSFLRNQAEGYPSVGAGVATVALSTSGVPSCTRLSHYWWSGMTEPWYGFDTAFLSADGAYIHAMGPANKTNAGGDYKYMTRVPIGSASTLSAYQYWNGTGWQSQRITAGVDYALVYTDGTPLTNLDRGQGMYNKYLKQYLWCERVGLDLTVHCYTSDNPQGPWSQPVKIFNSATIGNCNKLPNYTGYTYAPSMHPWYDDTQRSLVFWFTCGPNIGQAVNVTFT